MYRNKRRNEGVLYQAPKNRNKINDEVKARISRKWKHS